MIPSSKRQELTESAEMSTMSMLENITSLLSVDTNTIESPSTIKIDASDVAKFLLSTDYGKNGTQLHNDSVNTAFFNKSLFNNNMSSEEIDLTTGQGQVLVKGLGKTSHSFSENALMELLRLMGHLWGDPNDVGGTDKQSEIQGVTDTYQLGSPPFELFPETIPVFENVEDDTPTNIVRNVSPTFVVTSSGNIPIYPWNIEDSQDGISTVFSSNETGCISQLVEASHWCYLYGVGFLLVIALLLNGVSLVVFQAKPLRKLPFSVYLTALSITDTIALFGHIPRKWLNLLYLSLDWGAGITFYDRNTIACKALTFISYAFRFLSSWLLVGLACERLVVSKNPYKSSKFRTLKSARHAIVYCIVASIIFNCHVLFTWKSVDNPSHVGGSHSCVPLTPSDFISVALTITTILTIVGLPFLIIFVVTIFTVRNFGAWNLRPRRLSTRAICRALLEKQATSMVVVVSGMFCLLSIPYTISWVVLLVQHFTSSSTSICTYIQISAARDISEVGFMFNYALKFLICIFTGRSVLSTR